MPLLTSTASLLSPCLYLLLITCSHGPLFLGHAVNNTHPWWTPSLEYKNHGLMVLVVLLVLMVVVVSVVLEVAVLVLVLVAADAVA